MSQNISHNLYLTIYLSLYLTKYLTLYLTIYLLIEESWLPEKEPNMFSSSEWKRPLAQIFTWFVRFVVCFSPFPLSSFYTYFVIHVCNCCVCDSFSSLYRVFGWKYFLKVLSVQLCGMSTSRVDYRSSSSSSWETDRKTDLEKTFSE